MKQLTEERLTFDFQSDDSTKYDDWSFYRNQFNNAFGSTKAIDFITVDARHTWLIEVKDYRHNRRTKPSDLSDEVAFKVRDALAGLVSAQGNANNPDERRLAKAAVRKKLRVVLHLEQHPTGSRLFPRIADPANLVLQLKQRLKAVDPHPQVVNQHTLHPQMTWTVTG
jgi:hypothetical protein